MRLNCLTKLQQKLMRELPEAYNRLVGMDVVEVVKRGSREEASRSETVHADRRGIASKPTTSPSSPHGAIPTHTTTGEQTP